MNEIENGGCSRLFKFGLSVLSICFMRQSQKLQIFENNMKIRCAARLTVKHPYTCTCILHSTFFKKARLPRVRSKSMHMLTSRISSLYVGMQVPGWPDYLHG